MKKTITKWIKQEYEILKYKIEDNKQHYTEKYKESWASFLIITIVLIVLFLLSLIPMMLHSSR